ncbi:SDR family NAD(P)-dependent oxidoreductase [Diplocloster modestus]|uniref:SDR family oxidoreductase n=1 Tax=Diplocloster modestus TaxID=2850322 RepID=A0ABS6K3D3_9FIRM|nr:SDR family oxidoreductase [Diplocloster modestus]MBU9725023.1 SDR family oxidoreductase [Diplocloster modestus]
MLSAEGKVVLITGGGRGIGYGIAQAFAEAGARIAITGRTASTLIEAAENLEADYGNEVLWITADGGDEAAVKGVVEKVIDKYGKLDCLVNNAQASKSGVMLADHTKDDFDLAVSTGLYATFFYMREAFPYLKESKGCVINFASGAGLSGKIGQSSYAAAKEGIRGLSRVAAAEWGEFGINVNVLCPLAMTPGLEKWKDEYPKLYKKTIDEIPLQRFADPEKDIGRVCVFLTTDDAAYITGETISLQGGVGLRP